MKNHLRGGTLNVDGQMFAHSSSWARILVSIAEMLSISTSSLLDSDELAAAQDRGDPTRFFQ